MNFSNDPYLLMILHTEFLNSFPLPYNMLCLWICTQFVVIFGDVHQVKRKLQNSVMEFFSNLMATHLTNFCQGMIIFASLKAYLTEAFVATFGPEA